MNPRANPLILLDHVHAVARADGRYNARMRPTPLTPGLPRDLARTLRGRVRAALSIPELFANIAPATAKKARAILREVATMRLTTYTKAWDDSVLTRHPEEDPALFELCSTWLAQDRAERDREGAWELFCEAVAADRGWDTRLAKETLQHARDAFSWGARAKAYDVARARKMLELSTDALDDAKRAMLQMTQGFSALTRNELRKLQVKSEGAGDLPCLEPKDLIRMAEFHTKLELLIRGAPTERTATDTGIDLSKLSDDELRAYRDLVAKAERR